MSQDQGEQSSVDVAEPGNSESLSAGERLKAGREALGLSVEDVSTRLKLSVRKIESFERGEVEGIATPVFVAGYLRAYARLLELSAEDVLEDFEMLSTASSTVEGMASDSIDIAGIGLESSGEKSNDVFFTGQGAKSSGDIFRNSSSLLIPAVLIVLVIAAVYLLLPADESSKEVRTANVADRESPTSSTGVAESPLVVNSQVEPQIESQVETPSIENSESSVAAEATVNAVFDQVEEDTVNEVEGNSVETDETESTVFQQSELAFVFNDESWVEVTDARGERLVYRLAKAGMSRTVTGVAPFTVQLGYVPGVEIFYNGVPYDMSAFAGRRSARFRVGQLAESTAGG